ncbi:hypothetical protein ACVWWP_003527 [Bradyrhizobium sp. LM3.6]
MLDRPLKHRSEQRIVAGDDRDVSLLLSDDVGDTPHHRDVDQPVGRVGRSFDQDHRDPALAHGLFRGLADHSFVNTIGEADGADRQTRKRIRQQGFRPAIERLGVQNDIARADESQDRGCDGRHAR